MTTTRRSPIHDLTGSRTSPRHIWYSHRLSIISLTLFFFGSSTLYLVEYHHPIAAPIAAVSFFIYGLLD